MRPPKPCTCKGPNTPTCNCGWNHNRCRATLVYDAWRKSNGKKPYVQQGVDPVRNTYNAPRKGHYIQERPRYDTQYNECSAPLSGVLPFCEAAKWNRKLNKMVEIDECKGTFGFRGSDAPARSLKAHKLEQKRLLDQLKPYCEQNIKAAAQRPALPGGGGQCVQPWAYCTTAVYGNPNQNPCCASNGKVFKCFQKTAEVWQCRPDCPTQQTWANSGTVKRLWQCHPERSPAATDKAEMEQACIKFHFRRIMSQPKYKVTPVAPEMPLVGTEGYRNIAKQCKRVAAQLQRQHITTQHTSGDSELQQEETETELLYSDQIEQHLGEGEVHQFGGFIKKGIKKLKKGIKKVKQSVGKKLTGAGSKLANKLVSGLIKKELPKVAAGVGCRLPANRAGALADHGGRAVQLFIKKKQQEGVARLGRLLHGFLDVCASPVARGALPGLAQKLGCDLSGTELADFSTAATKLVRALVCKLLPSKSKCKGNAQKRLQTELKGLITQGAIACLDQLLLGPRSEPTGAKAAARILTDLGYWAKQSAHFHLQHFLKRVALDKIRDWVAVERLIQGAVIPIAGTMVRTMLSGIDGDMCILWGDLFDPQFDIAMRYRYAADNKDGVMHPDGISSFDYLRRNAAMEFDCCLKYPGNKEPRTWENRFEPCADPNKSLQNHEKFCSRAGSQFKTGDGTSNFVIIRTVVNLHPLHPCVVNKAQMADSTLIEPSAPACIYLGSIDLKMCSTCCCRNSLVAASFDAKLVGPPKGAWKKWGALATKGNNHREFWPEPKNITGVTNQLGQTHKEFWETLTQPESCFGCSGWFNLIDGIMRTILSNTRSILMKRYLVDGGLKGGSTCLV